MAKDNKLVELQRQLINWGYLAPKLKSGRGADDGFMGPKTLEAIRKAQAEGKLDKQNKIVDKDSQSFGVFGVSGLPFSYSTPFNLEGPNKGLANPTFVSKMTPKLGDLDHLPETKPYTALDYIKSVNPFKDRNEAIPVQQGLIELGYLPKTNKKGRTNADGYFYYDSQTAYEKAQRDGYKWDGKTFTKDGKSKLLPKKESTLKQFGVNFLRDPLAATIDAKLSMADKLGAPSNATNYLRDLNANWKYRLSSAVRGGINTLINGGSYQDNRNAALANPTFLEDLAHIRPLPVTEENFSPEELQILSNMAGEKMSINNADIKRETPDGKYGGAEGISKYFTPHKVVLTAIGKASGNKEKGYITDLFDVNTSSTEAQHDNNMYLRMALDNPRFNYQTLRATMPYTNATDVMPDRYKIASKIQLK